MLQQLLWQDGEYLVPKMSLLKNQVTGVVIILRKSDRFMKGCALLLRYIQKNTAVLNENEISINYSRHRGKSHIHSDKDFSGSTNYILETLEMDCNSKGSDPSSSLAGDLS